MRRRAALERGQATVELVGVLPLVVVLGFAVWQAAVAGQAMWMAGAAARAAARAAAVGAGARAGGRHRPGARGARRAAAATGGRAAGARGRRRWGSGHGPDSGGARRERRGFHDRGGALRASGAVRRASGQATVELVGVLPLAVLVALVGGQLLAAGAARELAGNAAEAGAAAILQGQDPEAAARDALPGWSDDHADVRVTGRVVRVRLRPVAVVPGIADRLAATVVADAGPAS